MVHRPTGLGCGQFGNMADAQRLVKQFIKIFLDASFRYSLAIW